MINPISSTLIEEKTYQPRVLLERSSFEPPIYYMTHSLFAPLKGSQPDVPSTIRRVPRVIKSLGPHTIQPPFKK